MHLNTVLEVATNSSGSFDLITKPLPSMAWILYEMVHAYLWLQIVIDS